MGQRIFRSDDTDTWVNGFGNGGDGDETVASNSTDAPVDASCSGTEDDTHVTVAGGAEASFTVGKLCLIIQMRGTITDPTGEFNVISGNGTSGRIDLENPLTRDYTDSGADQAQIIEIDQLDNFEVSSTYTFNVKAWDGNVGGVLVRFAKTSIVVDGVISGDGRGFRGGVRGIAGGGDGSIGNRGYKGESATAATVRVASTANNGSGGGGGPQVSGGNNGGGGGGGHGGAGTTPTSGGVGGATVGNTELTTLLMGGAGGGGGCDWPGGNQGGNGGDSGAIIILISKSISGSGTITSDGANGSAGITNGSGGGAGSGGAVLLKGQTVDLSSMTITITGGSGGNNTGAGSAGAGGVGRGHVDYSGSYSSPSSESPTLNTRQDSFIKPYTAGGAYALLNFL